MNFLKPDTPRKGSPADRGRGRVLAFPIRPRVIPEPADLWRRFWQVGPGIVSGSSNLDPSAVVTATVIGAAYSYSLLWVVVLCIPFLWALFSVTARIGVETRKGVLDLVRESYGKRAGDWRRRDHDRH